MYKILSSTQCSREIVVASLAPLLQSGFRVSDIHGVYDALLPRGVHYTFVVRIGQAIAITCAFFNYWHFVFRSSGDAWGEYARFVSVYFVAVLLNMASMVALLDWIKLGVLTSQALSTSS